MYDLNLDSDEVIIGMLLELHLAHNPFCTFKDSAVNLAKLSPIYTAAYLLMLFALLDF